MYYVNMTIPNKAAANIVAGQAINTIISQQDASRDATHDMLEAVKEALSNAVTWSKSETIDINIEVDNEKDELRVKVTDHGVGIENIEKVTEPFYSSDDEAHSGMGFTVMEQFAKKFAVESKVGEGTTVTLTMFLGNRRK